MQIFRLPFYTDYAVKLLNEVLDFAQFNYVKKSQRKQSILSSHVKFELKIIKDQLTYVLMEIPNVSNLITYDELKRDLINNINRFRKALKVSGCGEDKQQYQKKYQELSCLQNVLTLNDKFNYENENESSLMLKIVGSPPDEKTIKLIDEMILKQSAEFQKFNEKFSDLIDLHYTKCHEFRVKMREKIDKKIENIHQTYQQKIINVSKNVEQYLSQRN